MFFSSIPIFLYAVFDEEFPNTPHISATRGPQNYLERNPEEYKLGQKRTLFNAFTFWQWLILGLWHAAIITFFT